jgi:hypothetical protein
MDPNLKNLEERMKTVASIVGQRELRFIPKGNQEGQMKDPSVPGIILGICADYF